MEYEIKFKRIDTGKQWGCGKIKEGKYGPQIGMKVSPELKAYLDSVDVGSWLNFNLYEPYEQKEPRSAAAKSVPLELDDSIDF